jgi:type IV pilus assembly protein PilB
MTKHSKTFDTLLKYGIIKEAEHIYLEPGEDRLLVRYVNNSGLDEELVLPKKSQEEIAEALESLVRSDAEEEKIFKLADNGHKVLFSFSFFSGEFGEKIFIRVATDRITPLDLEGLGISSHHLSALKRNLDNRDGVILATGPTNSGRTTTLYSILDFINHPSLNISTIEDPIEYYFSEINQYHVAAETEHDRNSFLENFLRKDADVVMIGEINDASVAHSTFAAAGANKLFLSSLDATDVFTALFNLYEMEIPLSVIASQIKMIMSQRLVKKICPACQESYSLDYQEIGEIGKLIGLPDILEILEKNNALVIRRRGVDPLSFYRGRGCAECDGRGYKDRAAIYEVMEVTPGIKNLISRKASLGEIKDQARKEGMVTLAEDGIMKALAGVTTVEEIMKQLGMVNED